MLAESLSIFISVSSAGLQGDVQQLNASIAVQMCKIFMDRVNDRGKWSQLPPGGATAVLPTVDIDEQFSQGKILY